MNIDNDDEGDDDEDDGAQYELNWMSLLNGCFIGTSGIKVLAVKVMSLLIAGVTLPDHKKKTKRHDDFEQIFFLHTFLTAFGISSNWWGKLIKMWALIFIG